MSNSLKGKRIAILATDGFEQAELMEPRRALEADGAETRIVSPSAGKIRGWSEKDWGESVAVDMTLDAARVSDFDALVLPGGVMNPDKLRMIPAAVKFVREFLDAKKPVAAICHGPWLLVEAGVVRGRTLTSWPSLQTDIRNAGGKWVDQEVTVDQGLVTSRKPADLPAFNRKMIEEIAEGIHAGRKVA
jgi:protease I